MLILLNKPYGVLCQFRDRAGRPTLADHVPVRGVYPAGRLDQDSEGLVLLTDDGRLQARIADPRHGLEKTYWAQVEGVPDPEALRRLSQGVALKDGRTIVVRPLRPEDERLYPAFFAAMTEEDMRRLGARPVPTRAGDAVFFDSYTPHASGPNLSAERRRVLYITYNRLSAGDHRARYYADKRRSFPPDIEREPGRTYTFRV